MSRGGRATVSGSCEACTAGSRCKRPRTMDVLPTLHCTWCGHDVHDPNPCHGCPCTRWTDHHSPERTTTT